LPSELGRQDSNLGSRDQNPLPYLLATPHQPFSLPSVAAEVPTLPDGGRAGKADTALTVGAASGASALGYAPSTVFSTKCRSRSADAAGRPPRRTSRHGLDGRRRKRRLSSWLRPIKPFSLQSVAAEVPTLPDGDRAGKADTALTVGAASGASALGYAPSNRSLYKVSQPNAD